MEFLNRNARRAADFGRQCVDVIDNATGKVVGQIAATGTGLAAASAHAAAPDFTTLTAAVDFSTATAAVLLVMAGLAGVYIVMKGGALILSKLRGG